MDGNGLQKNGTRKIAQVNVSVLVYTWAKRRQEHMRELRSEGNLRKECSLQFDCIYKQRDNHVVTADMFYSMDAVIVGTQAVRNLKQLFPFFLHIWRPITVIICLFLQLAAN